MIQFLAPANKWAKKWHFSESLLSQFCSFLEQFNIHLVKWVLKMENYSLRLHWQNNHYTFIRIIAH